MSLKQPKYNVFRNLVLVRKVESQTSAIILPDAAGDKFLRLEVLAVGPDVKENIEPGMIVLAEKMFEQVSKKDKNLGLIVSGYIVMEDFTYGTN